MTKPTHPLPVGTRVYHHNQQWSAARAGTATVREVRGPYRDGSWEYRVDATADFSRQPGPANPENRSTWWNSLATIPAAQSIGRRRSKESS